MTTMKTDLTLTQLTLVMYLCNGMTLHEMAVQMHCSDANVAKHLTIARRKMEARTLSQLASIVIASGQLEMTDNGRVIALPAPQSAPLASQVP